MSFILRPKRRPLAGKPVPPLPSIDRWSLGLDFNLFEFNKLPCSGRTLHGTRRNSLEFRFSSLEEKLPLLGRNQKSIHNSFDMPIAHLWHATSSNNMFARLIEIKNASEKSRNPGIQGGFKQNDDKPGNTRATCNTHTSN